MIDKALSSDKSATEDQPGACWITDSQTGQQKCHYITKAECDRKGGVFYGGLCPPGAEADMMSKSDVVSAKKARKTKSSKKAKGSNKTKKARKTEKSKKKASARNKQKPR